MINFIKSETNFNSIIKIQKAIKKTKENGYEAIALIDDYNLHSVYDFLEECKKQEIKGIIGLELFFEINNVEFKGTILVKNDIGYKNISKISAISNKFNNKTLNFDEIIKYKEGLLIIIDFENYINSNKEKITDVLESIKKIKNILNDELYLSINSVNEEKYKETIALISKKLKIQTLAVDVSLCVNKTEEKLLFYLNKINNKKVVESDLLNKHIKTTLEFEKMFENYKESIENSSEIILKSNFNLLTKGNVGFKDKYPKFQIKEDVKIKNNLENYFTPIPGFVLTKNEDELKTIKYLIDISWKNFLKYYDKTDKVAIKRLKMELGVIIGKGFSNYFLIISDIISYAKKNNIMVSVRGSVVSSILARILGITEICPIKYGLKFERFLNYLRSDNPDIDIDVSQKNRYLLIKYIQDKYGKNKVSLIVTFNNHGLKNAISSLGKHLGINNKTIGILLENLPNDINNIKHKKEVFEMIRKDEKLKNFVMSCYYLSEYPKSISKSAAGVIIGNENLIEQMPIHYRSDKEGEFLITQYHNNKSQLEKLGYLKVDILGLRNLDLIDETKELIMKRHSKKINDIPLDDSKTIDLYKKGDLIGLFQVGSDGMREASKLINPSSINDIIALVALYRPGPKNEIEKYAYNKNNGLYDVYDTEGKIISDERIKEVLKETYGVLTYQEQIYSLAMVMANYEIFEADVLRVAISKKNKDILEKERIKFVSKSVENGFDENISNRVYDLIIKFGDYGLNKAHSAAYAIFSYNTGWLKINYSNEYMTVLMNSVINSKTKKQTNKAAKYFLEAKKMKLKLNKPNINTSGTLFNINEKGEIEFGLSMTKNIGSSYVDSIVKEREMNGLFKSFDDFIDRIGESNVVNDLIKIGVFDEFSTRKSLLERNQKNKRINFQNNYTFDDLFDSNPNKIKEEEFELEQILKFENELLCMNLTDNGIEEKIDLLIEKEIKKRENTNSLNWHGSFITNIRKVKTKKNNLEMAYLKLMTGQGETEVTVFNKKWEEIKDIVKIYEPVLIKIDGNERGDILLEIEIIKVVNEVTISVEKNDIEAIKELKKIISSNPGEDRVVILFNGEEMILDKSFNVNEVSLNKIKELIKNEIIVKKSSM